MHNACKMTAETNAAPIGRYRYVQTALTKYSNLLNTRTYSMRTPSLGLTSTMRTRYGCGWALMHSCTS